MWMLFRAAFTREANLQTTGSQALRPDLVQLVTDWQRQQAPTQDVDVTASLLSTLQISAQCKPPTKVTKTLASVHAVNILSVAYHVLQRRVFDTKTAEYSDSSTPCIVTSAADKNVIVRVLYISALRHS